MRNFRNFVNQPAGNDPASNNFLGATNLNNLTDELENSVSRSGQSLSTDDGTDDTNKLQLAESLFLHGSKSTTFQDSGTANSYQITPVSGANGVKIPENYDNMDGVRVAFVPANANTGNSTLDMGQTSGALIGAKKILTVSGSEITAGALSENIIYEMYYNASADSNVGAFILTSWSDRIGPQFRGALVYLSADESIPNNAPTSVAWETEDYDTSDFWTNSSPTRLTIPAGVSRVRVSASVSFNVNTTGVRQVLIYKNGAFVIGGADELRAPVAGFNTNLLINTAIISVSPGDYFECLAFQNSGAALDVVEGGGGVTWFNIEVLE